MKTKPKPAKKSTHSEEFDQNRMTETEAAVFLRRSVFTMRDWRAKNIGPDWYKFERGVVYRLCDLESWVESKKVTTSG